MSTGEGLSSWFFPENTYSPSHSIYHLSITSQLRMGLQQSSPTLNAGTYLILCRSCTQKCGTHRHSHSELICAMACYIWQILFCCRYPLPLNVTIILLHDDPWSQGVDMVWYWYPAYSWKFQSIILCLYFFQVLNKMQRKWKENNPQSWLEEMWNGSTI